MADHPSSSVATAVVDAPAKPLDRAAIAASIPEIGSGARWFWWIAGLSLINTVLMHTDSDRTFIIGLGFTLVADAMFQELPLIAWTIDAIAIGFFVAMGWLAGRGHMWAFVVGILCYAGDGLIYLYFQDWPPLVIHVLALIYLVRAAVTLRGALQAAALQPAA